MFCDLFMEAQLARRLRTNLTIVASAYICLYSSYAAKYLIPGKCTIVWKGKSEQLRKAEYKEPENHRQKEDIDVTEGATTYVSTARRELYKKSLLPLLPSSSSASS